MASLVKLSARGSAPLTHQKSVFGVMNAPANMWDKPERKKGSIGLILFLKNEKKTSIASYGFKRCICKLNIFMPRPVADIVISTEDGCL
jgi:hypothetical protein